MLITRIEKLGQLLTEDCKRALAEIDEAIQAIQLEGLGFEGDDGTTVILTTSLSDKEEALIKEVIELAGWKNPEVRKGRVHFYL